MSLFQQRRRETPFVHPSVIIEVDQGGMKDNLRLPFTHLSSFSSRRHLSPHRHHLKKRLTPRTLIIWTTFITTLVFGTIKIYQKWKAAQWERNKPPLYEKYHHAELALSQHDAVNAFSGGKKYLWVNNHVAGLGWGNYLEDLIMNAQVAYSSGRSFVFDNYTWNRDNTEYSGFDGKVIPSQIPLSVHISGPIIGGPFVEGDRTPLSVHKKYFDEVCPFPKIVETQAVAHLMRDEHPSAKKILDTWSEYLRDIDEPCVEIAREADRLFDYRIYGEPERLLSIWPILSESPILRLLGWSPLVHAAFDLNRDLFAPIQPIDPYPTPKSLQPLRDPYFALPGLLVLHIRRGDFEEHCAHLARWGSSFNAFNAFPELSDQWTTPSGIWKGDPPTEENLQLYLRRCFPSIAQIVEKVEEVRITSAGQGLKDIYVMTNAKPKWAEQLKAALRKKGGWEKIATSRDLVLTKEQKYVAQAVDMLIGQRAQVLIGNGFSSLTSDIVMLRRARKLPPDSNRFW